MNEPDRIYCIRCRKYLSAKGKEQARRTTVWETGLRDPVPKPDQRAAGEDADQSYVVICPECRASAPAPEGVIPLACSQCGYFFQAGLDLAVPEASLSSGIRQTADIKDTGNTPAPAGFARRADRKNPMPAAVRDTSSLRLILLTQPGVLPETVGEYGGILGERGTILRMLKTSQQIDIHHSPSGWYARMLKGTPYYNGNIYRAGQQIKLSDQDLIIMEQEQIRVEIT